MRNLDTFFLAVLDALQIRTNPMKPISQALLALWLSVLCAIGLAAMLLADFAKKEPRWSAPPDLEEVDPSLTVEISPDKWRCNKCERRQAGRVPKVWVPTGEHFFTAWCLACAPKVSPPPTITTNRLTLNWHEVRTPTTTYLTNFSFDVSLDIKPGSP